MSIAEKLTTIAENEQRVFEAGKTAEYDRFWDAHQLRGKKTRYHGSFYCWATSNFKPKYDIKPTTSERIFCAFGHGETPFDLQQLIDDAGIVVDFSKSDNMNYAFNMCHAKRIGVIDLISATTAEHLFSYARYLETIEKLKLNRDCNLATAFKSCDALRHISIGGNIGCNVNFAYCKQLTPISLLSILNHLYNYAAGGDTSTHTCQVGTTNINKLKATEEGIQAIAEATQKGWTVN